MQKVLVQLEHGTRARLFSYKTPGVTYDEIINRACDALDEQNILNRTLKNRPGNEDLIRGL